MVIERLEVGQIYDVAEIFEDPGRVMARSPGDSDWPIPGESRFGLAPELFEGPAEEIDIHSCRYSLNTVTYDMFGYVIQQPDDITTCKQLDEELDAMEEGAPHGATAARVAEHFVGVTSLQSRPEFWYRSDVVWPVRGAVGFLGYTYQGIVHSDLSRKLVTDILTIYVSLLNAHYSEPGQIAYRFWHGDGKPHLLTPGQ
jgi:hypothetical protein